MTFNDVKGAAWNMLLPISSVNRAVGQGTHVVTEVAVQKAIRKMLGRDTRSFVELATISYLSSIYQGAFAAVFSDKVMDINDQSTDNTVMLQTAEGAKMSLSVILADYIYQTSSVGLHFPWKTWSFVDLLYLLGGKTISRTVERVLSAPKGLGIPKIGDKTQDDIINAQVQASVFKSS